MKKLLSLVAAMIIAATAFAQVDEVTLTVIGTGVNEEQATLQALRSAIEQSFGTFVSANTTILNDELVQDEIVSVSTGNVKKYDKLAVATLSNNQVSVSLKATVSINKLISYAKSKGSRAEFAGQAFAANVKLIRLKVQSIDKAYNLMVQQLESISKDMFDFELKIKDDPQLCNAEKIGKVYYFDCDVNIISNIASTNFYNLYNRTINELVLTPDEIKLCSKENIQMINLDKGQVLDLYFLHDTDLRSIRALPMTKEKLVLYDTRIRQAIYKAGYRYSIQEIGNPINSYIYKLCKDNDGCWPICIGYNEQNRRAPKGRYLLYSRRWDEFIHLRNQWWSVFCGSDILSNTKGKTKEFISKFALKEVRTPIKLSKKEQKQVANGTFAGATYTVSYSDPQIIAVCPIRIAVPANSIEKFQGFEIKQ